MIDTETYNAFSDTYAAARAKFLTLALQRSAQIHSFSHPTERGAQEEELAIDIAIFGDPDAEKTLLLISGTHGLEGFTGSAIQIEFLRNLDIPPGVNVVALHALNPWGFSHLSRSDEKNIDLNRNFCDFSAPLESNDFYSEVHQAFCPDDWNEEAIAWEPVRDEMIRKHGWNGFLTAATGGQFAEPTGLNFCGLAPSWSHSMMAEHLPKILGRAKKVAFVEWHTGLGKFGELCYISLEEPGSSSYERIFEWMGEAARESFTAALDGARGETPSYTGPFSIWLPGAAPNAEWAGLVIEVGTYDNKTVANALRMDRWLKFGRGSASASREDIRETMIKSFYPSAPEWREAALVNGCEAQMRAFRGLQRW